MRCPFCGSTNTRVVDSRDVRDGESVRRRRECTACSRRFTTYENVEQRKRCRQTGRPAGEIRSSQTAGKTPRRADEAPVPTTEVDRIVRETEAELLDLNQPEVTSTDIGEIALGKLRELDQVAYIRFASVYREFRDLDDWRREMAALDQIPTNES
ncbi:MAG: transcriptional regulator NrdR [Thermomicrobiales bacterium]